MLTKSGDGQHEEIVDTALRIKPEEVCLVPEKREEVTTEGGLDVIAQRKRELEPTIKRLQVAGIRVSLFIDPTLEQVDAAAELGVEMVELHTGSAGERIYRKDSKRRTGTTATRLRAPHQILRHLPRQRRARHQLQEHCADKPHSCICPN